MQIIISLTLLRKYKSTYYISKYFWSIKLNGNLIKYYYLFYIWEMLLNNSAKYSFLNLHVTYIKTW